MKNLEVAIKGRLASFGYRATIVDQEKPKATKEGSTSFKGVRVSLPDKTILVFIEGNRCLKRNPFVVMKSSSGEGMTGVCWSAFFRMGKEGLDLRFSNL